MEHRANAVVNEYVTLDHKTSHKGQFFEIEMYGPYESWTNKLSIDVWFVRNSSLLSYSNYFYFF